MPEKISVSKTDELSLQRIAEAEERFKQQMQQLNQQKMQIEQERQKFLEAFIEEHEIDAKVNDLSIEQSDDGFVVVLDDEPE